MLQLLTSYLLMFVRHAYTAVMVAFRRMRTAHEVWRTAAGAEKRGGGTMRKKSLGWTGLMSAAVIGAGLLLSGQAADADEWWPMEVYDLSNMSAADFDAAAVKPDSIDYVPLSAADVTQKWHLCVLAPHLKDPSWVGINYGVVDEVRRFGLKMTFLAAGGYTELTKQLSQFDDCLSLGVDAIVIGVISEAGMAAKMKEASAQGVPVIAYVNPVSDTEIDAVSTASYNLACRNGGAYLAERYKDTPARMVSFPGAPGSGWAEACQAGMEAGIAGSPIELLEAKYGDTGKSVQLKLIEDALQTYDDIDILFNVGVSAEVAVDAVDEAGLSDEIQIYPWQVTPQLIDNVRDGIIAAAGSVLLVPQSRIAVDLAVRILEGKPYVKRVFVNPLVFTHEKFDEFDPGYEMAPEGYRPVFSVD